MSEAEDLAKQDHYKILGLEDDIAKITLTQISQAYRNMARKYHPDKVKHKPESEQKHAATMFLKVQKANEILSDETKRGEYDRVQDAKRIQKRKEAEMDASRRKMTDDLKRREAEANAQKQQRRRPAPEQAEDLSWLNKSKPFKMPKADPSAQASPSSGLRAIKVKWSKKKTYSKEEITDIFATKFGEIDYVILGEEKRKGRPNALVAFKNPANAQTAMETKVDGFKASWPTKQPDVTPSPTSTSQQQSTPFFSPFSNRSPFGVSPFTSPNFKSPFASPFGTVPTQSASSPADLEDFEMQTLMRLQKAAKLQKEQEQKNTPEPQQTPEKPTPSSSSESGTTSYIHPLNFNTPPPSTEKAPSTSTPSASNTPTQNGYNYFQTTDFESMEERKLRQAAERQKLIDELAQSNTTVNS